MSYKATFHCIHCGKKLDFRHDKEHDCTRRKEDGSKQAETKQKPHS